MLYRHHKSMLVQRGRTSVDISTYTLWHKILICPRHFLNKSPQYGGYRLALFHKSVKGHNVVKKTDRVMSLGQIVALIMVNKWVKFEENSFNSMEIIDEVKVCGQGRCRPTRTQHQGYDNSSTFFKSFTKNQCQMSRSQRSERVTPDSAVPWS